MICPYCGKVDSSVPTPEHTKTRTRVLLGTCDCGKQVWAIPTQRMTEISPLATVMEGETREEILVKAYLNHEGGYKSIVRGLANDIDRDVYDKNGDLIYYLEIKERSNSINAYYHTMFPFAKIESGRKLLEETGLPVYIVLKFIDCWARHSLLADLDYEKGKEPFAPRYRPWQRSKTRQVPVMIPVENLEILAWRDLCEEIS